MQTPTGRNAFATVLVPLLVANAARASSEQIVFQFSRNTGSHPVSGLASGSNGAFYGSTARGGHSGLGTIYKLAPNPDGTWSETILYMFSGRFNGSDGEIPWATPVFDAAGNLYGTTPYGGSPSCDCGTVYKLTPNQNGTWSEKIVYTFTGGDDGAEPFAGVILDGAGNIYGAASSGGTRGFGTIYRLSPNRDGTYTGSVLHEFAGGRDGAQPMARLAFDGKGNLFGTTYTGGVDNVGTVFALSPAGKRWQETIVYHFQTGPYENGFYPLGGVTFDSAGNLYGTTHDGGKGKRGTVFELTPTPSGPWKANVLLNFEHFRDSGGPRTDLVFDTAGNLYGTAAGDVGGAQSHGSVFELSPNGETWTEIVLWNFQGMGGSRVTLFGQVAFDAAGNIYGTSLQGIDPDCGFVYKISP